MHRNSSPAPRWIHLLGVLAWALALFVLGACGGRSDQDALAGLVDANLVGRDTGPRSDAPADVPDASVADAADVSVEVGPFDAGLDARFDVVDARFDVVDARFDARDVGPDARVLVSIAITPPTATLAVGTRVTLTVTGTYSDGTTADVTGAAAFQASSSSVILAGNVATARVPGRVVITARVNGLVATSLITVTPASITSIAVSPAMANTGVGGTVLYAAVATLSDGTTQDVTTSATWTSTNGAVATISTTGVARGVGAGTTTIRATILMVSGAATLTVTPARLVSIAVTPTMPVVGVGVTIPFRATGTYADGSIADLTATVMWSSSDTRVLTITNAGVATTLAVGRSAVTAGFAGLTASTVVTVTPATLVSIAVTPVSSVLAVGGTVPLVATATYSDMTTADVTASVTWASSATNVAVVSNATGSKGVVTAVGAGGAAITATLGAVSGAAKVTVTAATLVRIDVTPTNPSIPLATNLALSARGTYSDGSSIDITTSVTWSTDDPVIASVSNAPGSQGLATGNALGTTRAVATLAGVTGSTTLTVTAAALVSISVTPANSTLEVGIRQSMKATGVYSDMTTVDLTTTAVWTTGNTGVATVSNASGAQGQLTATGVGTTTVTATFGGVAGSTNVTVGMPSLVQVVVQPINPTNHVGENRQFVAIAIFSNGTQRNLMGQAMWSSSNTAVATIGPMGMATARAVGMTTISATFQGLTGSTLLTVTDAVPVSISVTPIAPSVAAGTILQFQATAIFSDNTTQNVTNQATWTSSDPAVASIATAGPMRGTARALMTGTTAIQASWQGLSYSTTLTVTAATLTRIQVTPFSPTLYVGFVTQFSATGIYSDNSTRDVTQLATWTSSASGVAAVSTGMATRGQVTPVSAGMATISASYQGVTGSTDVIVSGATLVSITVTPANAMLAPQASLQYIATGMFSDGSQKDITMYVTWLSSDTKVADVSNAATSRGLAKAFAPGMTTIAAVRGSVMGATTLSVQ